MQAAGGACTFGERCHFAHGPADAVAAASAGPYAAVDVAVVADGLSDHGWPLFETAEGPLLSANLMCSGENHDPDGANSFCAHPRDWHRRYEGLVAALRRNAEEARELYGRYPVMALQEFPRRNFQARAHELDARLREEFPAAVGWQVLYGCEKDAPAHDFSQMCVLVPPGDGSTAPARRWRLQADALRCCGPAGGQYGAPRFQVAQLAKPRDTPCRSRCCCCRPPHRPQRGCALPRWCRSAATPC